MLWASFHIAIINFMLHRPNDKQISNQAINSFQPFKYTKLIGNEH